MGIEAISIFGERLRRITPVTMPLGILGIPQKAMPSMDRFPTAVCPSDIRPPTIFQKGTIRPAIEIVEPIDQKTLTMVGIGVAVIIAVFTLGG